MFEVGFSEIIFLGIIAIVFLGPDKLPEVIRYIAKIKAKFDILKKDLNQTLEKEFELNQLKSELSKEITYVSELEKKLDQYLAKMDRNTIQLNSNLSEKLYFPVEDFSPKIPFLNGFIIQHLMLYPCLKI
ncbi:preprotein translocase subunit TatB [Acinetobacter sp. 194]|uniref:preprotein translocase subunit TatB n=1 Tax=Acinetobacter shaoyimingii TaxID=2715164 RepID=UPI0014084E89|nr:preprotein translocase subunit TatB [Acinetobacter shaoyimingii]NHB57698.1 preprotein translocase subunit TatB [Acinetobacter shaoyimingii]